MAMIGIVDRRHQLVDELAFAPRRARMDSASRKRVPATHQSAPAFCGFARLGRAMHAGADRSAGAMSLRVGDRERMRRRAARPCAPDRQRDVDTVIHDHQHSVSA